MTAQAAAAEQRRPSGRWEPAPGAHSEVADASPRFTPLRPEPSFYPEFEITGSGDDQVCESCGSRDRIRLLADARADESYATNMMPADGSGLEDVCSLPRLSAGFPRSASCRSVNARACDRSARLLHREIVLFERKVDANVSMQNANRRFNKCIPQRHASPSALTSAISSERCTPSATSARGGPWPGFVRAPNGNHNQRKSPTCPRNAACLRGAGRAR